MPSISMDCSTPSSAGTIVHNFPYACASRRTASPACSAVLMSPATASSRLAWVSNVDGETVMPSSAGMGPPVRRWTKAARIGRDDRLTRGTVDAQQLGGRLRHLLGQLRLRRPHHRQDPLGQFSG